MNRKFFILLLLISIFIFNILLVNHSVYAPGPRGMLKDSAKSNIGDVKLGSDKDKLTLSGSYIDKMLGKPLANLGQGYKGQAYKPFYHDNLQSKLASSIDTYIVNINKDMLKNFDITYVKFLYGIYYSIV